jgi:hypothetical protein
MTQWEPLGATGRDRGAPSTTKPEQMTAKTRTNPGPAVRSGPAARRHHALLPTGARGDPAAFFWGKILRTRSGEAYDNGLSKVIAIYAAQGGLTTK